MAPEIVKKTPYDAQAADVWAAGVILYLIYVGKLPFFGEFEADLFRKILTAKYTPVPRELGDNTVRTLLSGIFQVNTSLRLTADQILNHLWLS